MSAPSIFDELVGQSHITEILQGAVAAARTNTESQEMTHDWIFTGPPGGGRLMSHDRLEAEPLAFHESVHQEFLQITRLDPMRHLAIDEIQTIDAIHNEITKRVSQPPVITSMANVVTKRKFRK